MKKKKIIGIFIALIIILRFFGIIDFDLGEIHTVNLKDYGEISSGSIQSSDLQITIDWKGDLEVRIGKGKNINVEITSFNAWDFSLFIPFYKQYTPEMEALVKDDAGNHLGTISLSDELTLIGLQGRGSILKQLKSAYSNQIIEYIDSRSKPNHDGAFDPVICQDQIGFSPNSRNWINDSLLEKSPLKTYYCLKNGLKSWRDTLFFANNLHEMDHDVTYEIVHFDRASNRIEQERFFQNGDLFLQATYVSRTMRNRSYFLDERKASEIGYSTDFGEIMSLNIYSEDGDTLISIDRKIK